MLDRSLKAAAVNAGVHPRAAAAALVEQIVAVGGASAESTFHNGSDSASRSPSVRKTSRSNLSSIGCWHPVPPHSRDSNDVGSPHRLQRNSMGLSGTVAKCVPSSQPYWSRTIALQ